MKTLWDIIGEEEIGACWVCGKTWQRKNEAKYLFFKDTVICANHEYADKWYIALLELAKQRFENGL